MKMESAREMFEHELADMRDAEQKLVTNLPKMQKKVSNESLAEVLEQHLEETKEQVRRIDQVFKSLEAKPKRQVCKGMAGLLDEFMTFTREEKPADEIMDVYSCAAEIKVEHYEISAYESLISMANKLGLEEAAQLLEENLNEEREALRKLQELGQELLAELPVGGEEEMEEEEEMEAAPAKRGRSR